MNYASEIAKILALAEEAGFQKGWQAARDALSAPMTKAKVAGSAAQTPAKKKVKKTKKIATVIRIRTTVEQQVKSCIETHPGKTGAEIIRLLVGVNPRTVRTMLRRLKQKGEIEKSGEGWFTKLE